MHARLIAEALDEAGRQALEAEVTRRKRLALPGDGLAHVGAYQDVVARLLPNARELSVALVEGNLEEGELVTLTQAFYTRADSNERGTLHAKLLSHPDIEIEARFSRSRLIGSTGRTEIFSRARRTVLAHVAELELEGDAPCIDLIPLFIGWRLVGEVAGLFPMEDRREVWPQQLDQFAKVKSFRVKQGDVDKVGAMSEDEVIAAFADIIGEPFVPGHSPGETSDLYSSRLSMEGEPLSAAFAFKGPGLKGKLQMSGMGKNGDQGIRLGNEEADLLVVQHHHAVAAPVRALMAAVASQKQRRFMIIDGGTTAAILRAYSKLPS